VAVNGGMPVNPDAMRTAYGPDAGGQIRLLNAEGGEKHHLARPDDSLVAITDIIPVPPPVHTVVSVGDLVSMAGAAWVVAGATLGASGLRFRRRRSGGLGGTVALPDQPS
jgi:hypothetical protein